MKEESIKLTLPIPISVNCAYTGIKRRRKSDEYKNWLVKAKNKLDFSEKKYTIKGDNWLDVTYVYHMPIYNKN